MIFHRFLIQVTLKSETSENAEVRIQVTANTGVAAAWGIHHYLKYFCKVHISWDVDQLSKILRVVISNISITLTLEENVFYLTQWCSHFETFEVKLKLVFDSSGVQSNMT